MRTTIQIQEEQVRKFGTFKNLQESANHLAKPCLELSYFEEGVDYTWNFLEGDDFPISITFPDYSTSTGLKKFYESVVNSLLV